MSAVGYSFIQEALSISALPLRQPALVQPVTFTLEMAQRALEVELQKETVFLECFDRIVAAVNENYDVRGDLGTSSTSSMSDLPNQPRTSWCSSLPAPQKTKTPAKAGVHLCTNTSNPTWALSRPSLP